MKKLFIKAAVVTLLFGTISGCKGAMPAQRLHKQRQSIWRMC